MVQRSPSGKPFGKSGEPPAVIKHGPVVQTSPSGHSEGATANSWRTSGTAPHEVGHESAGGAGDGRDGGDGGDSGGAGGSDGAPNLVSAPW